MRREGCDESNRRGDVLRLKHFRLLPIAYRLRTRIQDWRIDFARIDVANPDSAVFLLSCQAGPKRPHGELRGRITRSTQGSWALSSDRRNVNDQPVTPLEHPWEHGMD